MSRRLFRDALNAGVGRAGHDMAGEMQPPLSGLICFDSAGHFP
jgi:hypothetical protein